MFKTQRSQRQGRPKVSCWQLVNHVFGLDCHTVCYFCHFQTFNSTFKLLFSPAASFVSMTAVRCYKCFWPQKSGLSLPVYMIVGVCWKWGPLYFSFGNMMIKHGFVWAHPIEKSAKYAKARQLYQWDQAGQVASIVSRCPTLWCRIKASHIMHAYHMHDLFPGVGLLFCMALWCCMQTYPWQHFLFDYTSHKQPPLTLNYLRDRHSLTGFAFEVVCRYFLHSDGLGENSFYPWEFCKSLLSDEQCVDGEYEYVLGYECLCMLFASILVALAFGTIFIYFLGSLLFGLLLSFASIQKGVGITIHQGDGLN